MGDNYFVANNNKNVLTSCFVSSTPRDCFEHKRQINDPPFADKGFVWLMIKYF